MNLGIARASLAILMVETLLTKGEMIRWSYASEAFSIAVYRASSSISRGVEALYGSSANQ